MNAKQRELLEAFGHAGSVEGGEFLSLDSMGDPSELLPVAENMVKAGWLRRGASPGAYTQTEVGLLALAGPLDVTLYTRPGCHLCDEAKTQIAPLLASADAQLREVNIDADDTLRQLYDLDVPVLFLGTRKVAKHRVDLGQFRKQLAEAARNAAKQTGT